jgi:hypothetical protein
MLDHFIEWVNNNGPKGARERLASVKVNLNSQLNATPEDVKNLIQAQTWTFNIEANSTGGQSMDETNVAGDHHSPNKANYTNTYFVYAFYAAGDTTTTPPKLPYDYYIVDQEAQVRSGNMYYGQWENNRFLGHTHNMAYYLADYYTDHYIVDSVANKYLLDSQVNIISPSPTTTTKSNTITTSISESFTGSLGFSGMGGTGGVSGGLSYSSSSTLNVPDMSVVFQGGMDTPYVSASSSIKKNARWTYQPALPTAVDNTNMFAPVAYYISDPPAISTSTAVFHNTWIWQVVNPAIDAKYRIISHSIPRHAWSILQKNWYTNPIRGHFDHYYMNLMAGDESTYYYANWVKYSLELIPPPRNLSAP